MSHISTATLKRIERSRRRRRNEDAVRTPTRNTSRLRFDASLRIAGIGARHASITIDTGLVPAQAHLAGDRRSKSSGRLGVWQEDLWRLASPLGEDVPLEMHLQWLWTTIAPHKAYFEQLIAEAAWADVCLGCMSSSVFPFWAVPADALHITRELKLGLSFNFTVT